MTVIGFLAAEETGRPVAPCPPTFDGQRAPYGFAGFIVGSGHVVCADCAKKRYDPEEVDPIFGGWETDYPGYTCGDWADCEAVPDEPGDAVLPGTLLVYSQHLPELSDRELWRLDMDDRAPEEDVQFVREARGRMVESDPDARPDGRPGYLPNGPNVPGGDA